MIQHLAQKQLLLVLDNWEQLVSAAEEIFEQLLSHTLVHVLATSRVRLMVEGEEIFRLQGLLASEGYALFVERARRIVASFAEPILLLLHCETVFRQCNQIARANAALRQAGEWVKMVSGHIRDEEIRTAFIARPDNHLLQDRIAALQTKR